MFEFEHETFFEDIVDESRVENLNHNSTNVNVLSCKESQLARQLNSLEGAIRYDN